MKEKILQMVDAYWKFDNQQQPISSWHDKQDLLKALEELLQHAVIKSVCDHNWKEWEDENCNAQMRCTKCKTVKQTVL